MAYDIVIKDGLVIDGSGAPGFISDLGIKDGRVAGFGRIREPAGTVIDAGGLAVTPGFIDGHTHMDAQVFWDPLGTGSCWHGVTSVVMGNCGVTLAPCRAGDAEFLMQSLEAIEDIAFADMKKGIDWRWGRFRDYLAALDALPKGINYAGFVGHSALRRFVMAERAQTETATDADLAAMGAELLDALNAGAVGFSTSRSEAHAAADGTPMPSRVGRWDEVEAMVRVMGGLNRGVFEFAGSGIKPEEPLLELAVETRVPMSFGILSTRRVPGQLEARLELIDAINRAGGRMVGQAHTRALTTVWSFRTQLPFDSLPLWRDVRALPLSEQRTVFADPERRKQLVEIAMNPPPAEFRLSAAAKVPAREGYRWVRVLKTPLGPNPTLAELATRGGREPVEVMIELALESDFQQFFMQEIANEDEDAVRAAILHPRSAVTFSDAGAHVSQIVDCALQSHLLAYWVREKQLLSLESAVRKITFDVAVGWGIADRGLLRQGAIADIVVFDPATVGPTMPTVAHDLPAGGARLTQKSQGFHASIVGGVLLLRDGDRHTGDFPGTVLRPGSGFGAAA